MTYSGTDYPLHGLILTLTVKKWVKAIKQGCRNFLRNGPHNQCRAKTRKRLLVRFYEKTWGNFRKDPSKKFFTLF